MAEAPDPHAVRVLDRAQAALKLRFPVTCATCEHLHRAWDSQADDCGKTQTCGGPILGRDFPDYKGPIKRSYFAQLCLICGSYDIRLHIVADKSRFGLCDAHRRTFDRPLGGTTIMPLVVPAGTLTPTGKT